MLQQQVQRKKEKMARLADLQRQIDEASEEVRHLVQDDQSRRPPRRELHQEGFHNEDDWYEDFHHGNFAFDDASPLSTELQATPWPQTYKPPQLPIYDGHSDPKQFLMSYEATISSYGGNTAVMAKSFVMAVRSIAQTWYSSLRPGQTVVLVHWTSDNPVGAPDHLTSSVSEFFTLPKSVSPITQILQHFGE